MGRAVFWKRGCLVGSVEVNFVLLFFYWVVIRIRCNWDSDEQDDMISMTGRVFGWDWNSQRTKMRQGLVGGWQVGVVHIFFPILSSQIFCMMDHLARA